MRTLRNTTNNILNDKRWLPTTFAMEQLERTHDLVFKISWALKYSMYYMTLRYTYLRYTSSLCVYVKNPFIAFREGLLTKCTLALFSIR